MRQNIYSIIAFSLPAFCGGIVAIINSARVNDITERVETWLRRRKDGVSVRKGFFSKWIVHPPLQIIVKLCDWTDALAHRGLKNGIRVAATLYVLGLWASLLIYACIGVLAVSSNPNILPILVVSIPAIFGGIIALVNSESINTITEHIEALMRRRQGVVSVRKGFFSKWIVHPPLQIIVKLCDWTDALAHRGLKNGIRVAATLYVLGFWVLLVLYAFMFVLALICAVIAVLIALWTLGEMYGDKRKPSLTTFKSPSFRSEGRETTSNEDDLLAAAGGRGQNIYSGTNWMNEELKGRVDEKGNIYSGTNWLNEDKIGRIDKDGNIFRGTGWLNEEHVGRIDSEGSIHKGTNWLNEEKVGRVDEKGNVYQGSNWLNEKKTGRTG